MGTSIFQHDGLAQEGHIGYDAEDDLLDVFDITEAEPDLLFINPFGCQVDPLSWRELQVCTSAFEMTWTFLLPAC